MTVVEVRRRPVVGPLASAEIRDQSVRRRVGTAWALMYFNTLTYVPGSILHLPSAVGKGLAQGALPLALLVALTVNPRVRVRPNVFLCILCLLVVDTMITATTEGTFGTIFRTFRLAEFVAGLWLLTPWWGRDDMMLLRYHLRCLYVALISVLLGLAISPGHAREVEGRLGGAIWPMEPTQVAQYAAVAVGLTLLLWLARMLSGRAALLGVTFATAILLLTHTRTALLALVVGLLLGGLSLFTVNARVRKFFVAGAATVSIGVVTVAGFVTTWLARGENTKGLESLTGRTTLWAAVLNVPRTTFQEVFGFGLSTAGVNGSPIDSNWLASYMQEGLIGVTVCAMVLVWLFVAAFFQPEAARRALALFLVLYCTVASFTEDSFTDVSTYLLHLAVAASLLVVPLTGRSARQVR